MEVTPSLQKGSGQVPGMWSGRAGPSRLDFEVKQVPEFKPTKEQLDSWNQAIDTAATVLNTPGRLWVNGSFPQVELPASASTEDIVAEAVNGTILGSKAYKVLLTRDLAGHDRISAALVTVGKKCFVMLYYYIADNRWWTRFYDAPTVKPPAGGIP